ncbi:MAG: hypothetical protein ABW072_13095 [Sedimenticola sp.]
MRFYSYVVARDYGFAPNPFGGVCTLATCKPLIRKGASIGDWVIGTGSARNSKENHVIFLMKVTKKLTFDEYWNDPAYLHKRPIMNGSLKQMYGDNIYHTENGEWVQEDSHHSYENGLVNMHNLERDTSADFVLISDHFYFFGVLAPEMPDHLAEHIRKKGPGYRCPEEALGLELVDIIESSHEMGYNGDPIQFLHFERYNGIS